MIKFTWKEKLVAILFCLMKHNKEEFYKCKWNDFIIMLMNKIGVKPEEFNEKISKLIP